MPPISPDRWRVLSPYLDEALEIPPDRRAAWVAAVSTRDSALGADLRSLLAEHDVVHQERFLDGAVLDPRATAAPGLAGQVLGAYKLLAPIGQGGSGSVWLAERCDGRFQGRAAVKVLNQALVARSGEERFMREGTILARLRHPRIAQLIDAGVSPAGLPYLVLEYVDGQAIDRYCDAHALGVEARIQLFLDVLNAVAYAHASLTVHRDIKPANVLVSTDGQVKLLDFGIARLLERNDEWGEMPAKSGPVTREVGRALTPEFAAPEQLSGGAVTTATDVYALGVLLYVLLTGQHPAGRAVDSPLTLVRAIVETEPPRVSDAVVSHNEAKGALVEHAARCGTTTSRLQRTLRGDLDTIVATALKKNTAERYASVTALADDLRRYLRHEPISARPDTVRYRTKTFVKRHTRAVGVAAAVVVMIAAMMTVHTIRLSAERDRAQREAAKAIKVSELLMGLLTRADPYAPRTTAEPTARHLLDAGAAQVQAELAGQPELQAEMLTLIGRTYRRLGVYDRAQPLLEQALAVGHQAFGAEHVRVAQTLHDLGTVLADRGDYPAAGRSLEQALAMRRTLLGPGHADVAVTLAELGRVYQDEGRNDRAEPLQREALEIRRKQLGERDRETAVSLSDLASVMRLKGDLASAESLLRLCLEINRDARGADHPNTATTMHDLALITASRDDQGAAERQLREALAVQRKALGDTHPLVAITLNNLAKVLAASNRYDEAAPVLQEALDIARPALGSRHQLVAIYTINAGAVQLALRQPAIAEALVREGLRIRAHAPGIVPTRRRTFPEDDWSTGATRSLLGAVLIALARYDEAEATLIDARHDLEALVPARDQDVKLTTARLVDLYVAWGKPDKAAAYRSLLSP